MSEAASSLLTKRFVVGPRSIRRIDSISRSEELVRPDRERVCCFDRLAAQTAPDDEHAAHGFGRNITFDECINFERGGTGRIAAEFRLPHWNRWAVGSRGIAGVGLPNDASFVAATGTAHLYDDSKFKVTALSTLATASTRELWNELAEAALEERQISRDDALAILRSSDDDLLPLLDAAFRVRRARFGRQVQLYFLKNAKSGLCPEDCGYCSQSIISDAPIQRYPMLNEAKLIEGADRAVEAQARTYCIVASGRGPTNREVDHLASVVAKIKDKHGLHICCCLGLLSPDQAAKLKSAGVDRVNHNLNTSRRFYDTICSTHSYDDRLDTLRIVREAGMELCSGVIAGMGESDEDLVDVAFELSRLGVASIPVNFLHAIDGTPLERTEHLSARDCLRILCLFRLTNPTSEVRVSGGREVNLRSMQAMSLYPANSLFVSDYLTTKGQPAEADFAMIEDLGFEVVIGDHEGYAAWKARQAGLAGDTSHECGGGSCNGHPAE